MTPKIIDKWCGSCRYWTGVTEYGQCIAPLPVSLSGWLVKLKPTFSTDGWDCKSYRKRINRRKKATVSQIRPQVGP
jgi:hypothetical protein